MELVSNRKEIKIGVCKNHNNEYEWIVREGTEGTSVTPLLHPPHSLPSIYITLKVIYRMGYVWGRCNDVLMFPLKQKNKLKFLGVEK